MSALSHSTYLACAGLRVSPAPFVISSEQRTFVGLFPSDDSPPTDGEKVIVVELAECTSVKFGFPNDEALHGHRLYRAGLAHYELHDVLDSAWLTQLRAVEAVHPRAPEVPLGTRGTLYSLSTIPLWRPSLSMSASSGSMARVPRQLSRWRPLSASARQ